MYDVVKSFFEPDYAWSIVNNSDKSSELINELLEIDAESLITIIITTKIDTITTFNVPYANNVESSIVDTIDVMSQYSPISYNDLAVKIKGTTSHLADNKYGELRVRLLQCIGLVKTSRKGVILSELTEFGILFSHLDLNDRKLLFSKIIMSVPIMKDIFISSLEGDVCIEDHLCFMQNSTSIRRAGALRAYFRFIRQNVPQLLLHSHKII